MTKEEILSALMHFSPESKWEIDPKADPNNDPYDLIIWKDNYYTKPTEKEIKDYNAAVGVIENHRRGVGTTEEYRIALDIMMKYETGQTGWRYISGK